MVGASSELSRGGHDSGCFQAYRSAKREEGARRRVERGPGRAANPERGGKGCELDAGVSGGEVSGRRGMRTGNMTRWCTRRVERDLSLKRAGARA